MLRASQLVNRTRQPFTDGPAHPRTDPTQYRPDYESETKGVEVHGCATSGSSRTLAGTSSPQSVGFQQCARVSNYPPIL